MDAVQDWVELVDARYPEASAESWDSVGLQVGDPSAAVEAVLVCLDVTTETLDEAVLHGANLVLAHHPLLFRPLPRLTPASAAGALALRAARAGIAVLAAHTNVDVAVPGTSDPITDVLGLRDVRPLLPRAAPGAQRLKLVTFVPRTATGAVISALSAAGGGVIGEYDECSFRVEGVGTFRPSAAANPAVGAREQRNEVAEDRLEMLLPPAALDAAVRALIAAHPYEEVAYDVYALVDAAPPVLGLGRVGELAAPLTLAAVADRLAEGLPSPHLRYGGEPERRVARVAACGGAGDSLIGAAHAAGADVFVTGDLRHHVSLDALTLGMAVVDAGHYATEAPALPALLDGLTAAAAERGLRARLLASAVRTEPLRRWSGGRT